MYHNRLRADALHSASLPGCSSRSCSEGLQGPVQEFGSWFPLVALESLGLHGDSDRCLLALVAGQYPKLCSMGADRASRLEILLYWHSPRTRQHSSESISFDSLHDRSREIHASTLILFAWVGIPLLRFHPHPSQRRSIGQTIGLTAYPPQRAAIFTTQSLTRACPAYFRLRALFEASDISTTSEPTSPSGIVSFGPSRSGVCQTFKLQGLAYSMSEDRSLRSPSYGQELSEGYH